MRRRTIIVAFRTRVTVASLRERLRRPRWRQIVRRHTAASILEVADGASYTALQCFAALVSRWFPASSGRTPPAVLLALLLTFVVERPSFLVGLRDTLRRNSIILASALDRLGDHRIGWSVLSLVFWSWRIRRPLSQVADVQTSVTRCRTSAA